MIRRYGTREETIQQAHVYDVEAMTDEERAFWRAVLVELRRCGFPKAAEQLTSLLTLPRHRSGLLQAARNIMAANLSRSKFSGK